MRALSAAVETALVEAAAVKTASKMSKRSPGPHRPIFGGRVMITLHSLSLCRVTVTSIYS